MRVLNYESTKYLKSKVPKTEEVLERFLFFVFLSEFSVGRTPSLPTLLMGISAKKQMFCQEREYESLYLIR